MIRKFIYSIFFLIFSLFAKAQAYNYDWAFSYKGLATGCDLLTDSEANSYILGLFTNTLDGDPGSDDLIFDGQNMGTIFIQKISPQGELVWIKVLGEDGTGIINGNAMALDTNGNIYVTGLYSGTIDFNPDSLENNITSTGATDGFLIKIHSDGNFEWVKTITGTGYTSVYGLTLDNEQNPIVFGTFSETADFDMDTSVNNLSSSGNRDIFIQKVDPDANLIWVKQLYGTSIEDALCIVAADQAIYITGAYHGTKDFDPGIGVYELTSLGDMDIYLAKLTNNGHLVWAKSIGGIWGEYPTDLLVDSTGDIIMSGTFGSPNLDFDPNSGSHILSPSQYSDAFVLKISSSGNFEWVKALGNVETNSAHDLALNSKNEIYVTGRYANKIDLDPGTGVQLVTTINDEIGCFTVLLDENGNYIWSQNVGRYGYEVCTDKDDNLFLIGSFSTTTDFDPGPGQANITTTITYSSFNMFLQKLSYETVGLKPILNSDISIYPNPAVSSLIVKRPLSNNCIITCYELNGKKIFEQQSSDVEILVNLENIASGTYTIELNDGSQIIRTKLVKI